MGRGFDPLRIFSSVSQSESEDQPRPHNHPNAQLCLTSSASLLQAQAECFLLQNYRITENCDYIQLFTLIFSTGIIPPHMLHCPFLATVYSFLSAVFHIPPGAAVENLLCLEPACPHQCWEQNLSSLNSCAVFAIKVMMWGAEGRTTFSSSFAVAPDHLWETFQRILSAVSRALLIVWACSWFYGKHSTAGVEG